MKLLSFTYQNVPGFGVVDGDQVINLSGIDPAITDLKGLLPHLNEVARLRPLGQPIPLAQVRFSPVIPNPDKIICVGLNYHSHQQETALAPADHPQLFVRFSASQVGHGGAIIRPNVSEKLDFEGELAVIIGRTGRHISRAQALDYVAGYSCYNDASIRDWQMHTRQFTPGKNFDGTGAFGPWLVSADEIPDPARLQLTTHLNAQVVQQAGLDQLIFPVPELIAYISTFTTLVPGDVIVTGTPAGVGVARKPRLYMQPGDQVTVSIDGIGCLQNPIEQEQ